MRGFKQKPKSTREAEPARSPIPGRAFTGQSREHKSHPYFRRTIGNIAIQRFLQTDAVWGESSSPSRASPRLSFAFRKTDLHADTDTRTKANPKMNNPVEKSEREAGPVAAQLFRQQPCANSSAPLIQRQIAGMGGASMDPIHDRIIKDYRKSQGLPPGGVDPVTGMQVGPSDADIKYKALWMNKPPKTSVSLGITGPSTVDHYCAKYVPSDAKTCGIFPAPNITLTATGVTKGTPVTWSVTKGKGKVKIVGSAAKSTVTISGVKKSKTQNDVTVQVKSGKTKATHKLSVLEPSSMTSVAKNKKTTSTLVGASLHYTVFDQFKKPMGAGICIDETIIECDSPYKPGVLKYGFKDAPTDKNGKAIDNIFVSNSSGIPTGFCVKLDQDITVGGCGPILRNIIVIQSTGITVTKGDCKKDSATCP